MSLLFEELAHHQTDIGELVLRRRRLRRDSEDIWEIMLDGGYLMTSKFVAGEIALADLALGMLDGERWRVVMGGLGLGYTAKAALDDPRVAALSVVELIPEVIGWHRRQLLPLSEALAGDRRCHLVEGDFFCLATSRSERAGAMFEQLDAILVDIDHSTQHLIAPDRADFYRQGALASLAAGLRSGGVFALWSSGAEDPEFLAAMKAVFVDVRAERVEFPNPYADDPAFNIIYLGRRR